MKLIKIGKAEEKEIAVGDIVKVIESGEFFDVPVSVVGVVNEYDSVDGQYTVYGVNNYDYFTSEQLEVVMHKDGSLPEPVEPAETTFDIQFTQSELQGIVAGIGPTTVNERRQSASYNGYPEKVAGIGGAIYDSIKEILQGAK